MAAFTRLAQFVDGATGDHLATMLQEAVEHVVQVQHLGPTIHQGHHVHAEGVLQLGLLEQLVEHHLGYFAPLELDHHAHARLVGLVADLRNALDLLLVDELGDALEQRALVHLVRQFIDDDRLAIAFFQILEMGTGPHDHATTAGPITVMHAREAVDQARGREVRRLDDTDQFFDIRTRIVEQQQTGLDDFLQVVRRNIGGHAHRDAGRTIDEQVRDTRRQHRRLLLLAIVVGYEIDGFLVNVGKQFARDTRLAALGVTHRRRIVAIDGTEVALSVDQHVAQGKILRHPHQRVVDGRITVRVIFTHHVTDHPRALHVGPVPGVVRLIHREQHPAMDRLESVPHIRQRAPDDHAHRVIEVGMAHFFLKADRERLFGELIHGVRSTRTGGIKKSEMVSRRPPDTDPAAPRTCAFDGVSRQVMRIGLIFSRPRD